jgi:hypothetical protein
MTPPISHAAGDLGLRTTSSRASRSHIVPHDLRISLSIRRSCRRLTLCPRSSQSALVISSPSRMTRGILGTFVYSTDFETRSFLKTLLGLDATVGATSHVGN